MKIIFLFITLIFIGNFVYSQTEKTENKIIAKNFENNNNNNNKNTQNQKLEVFISQPFHSYNYKIV